MGRGRTGGKQDHLDDSWRLKHSLHNQSESNSSSHENLQSPQPIPAPNFQSKSRKPPNSKWVSRNGRAHVAKTMFVKKSEVGSSSSSSEVKEQERVDEQKQGGGEEGEGQRKVQADLSEEVVEDSDSIDDVADIGSVLEKLALGVEEPELSEDQQKINAQLQEDEVIP